MIISVFTPTFNSTATLTKAFNSLQKQTNKSFEWIVVDDCSTDNGQTKDLIEQLFKIASFPCKSFYLEQNNFGAKSMAKALEMASGELFSILDHDDEYTENAIAKVLEISEHKLFTRDIAGIVGRVIDERGNLIGKPFKNDFKIDYEGQLRYDENIHDELLTFFRPNILKKYVSIMKAGFTYGILMAKISEEHKMLFVNDIFRIYDTAISTSYTNSKNLNTRFIKEKAEQYIIVLDINQNLLHKNPLLTLRQLVHTNYLIIKCNLIGNEYKPKTFKVKFLMTITKPLGILKNILQNCKK